MFQKHLEELLPMIHFELCDFQPNQLIVQDLKCHPNHDFFDVLSFPCSFLSDDSTRKIEAYPLGEKEVVEVSSTPLHQDVSFYKVSSIASSCDDSYTFEVEDQGDLVDVSVGKVGGVEQVQYRLFEKRGEQALISSVTYTPSSLRILRQLGPRKELFEVEKSGRVRYSQDGKVLEDFLMARTYQDMVGGALSLSNHIVERGHCALQKIGSKPIPFLIERYPFFWKFMTYLEDSYQNDTFDSFYQQYHPFTDEATNRWIHKG